MRLQGVCYLLDVLKLCIYLRDIRMIKTKTKNIANHEQLHENHTKKKSKESKYKVIMSCEWKMYINYNWLKISLNIYCVVLNFLYQFIGINICKKFYNFLLELSTPHSVLKLQILWLREIFRILSKIYDLRRHRT